MAAGCANATVGELQEMKNDLARHEEVLETVSAFAAQLHEHMQTRTDREGVTQAPAVAQACGEIAGVYCHHTCLLQTSVFRPSLFSPCLVLSPSYTGCDLGNTSGGGTERLYRALPFWVNL